MTHTQAACTLGHHSAARTRPSYTMSHRLAHLALTECKGFLDDTLCAGRAFRPGPTELPLS